MKLLIKENFQLAEKSILRVLQLIEDVSKKASKKITTLIQIQLEKYLFNENFTDLE